MTQFYTLQVHERLLVDRTPRDGGEVIPPIPYISESLVVDVCKINSTVFPNLGSMTHSKVSGWLCQWGNAEKKLWEGVGFSKYTSIIPDKTRGKFGFTNCSIARDLKTSCDCCYCEPYIYISKRLARTYTCTYIRTMWLVQVWKHLPTSKAKYQLLWIKRLAGDEALGTKRFRIIIHFRVPSQSPEGNFERGGGPIANWCKRKVTDHMFAKTKVPLGIWYPRYWSLSLVAWGIPIEKESQY